METIYECQSCGVVGKNDDTICYPKSVTDWCEYERAYPISESGVCESVRKEEATYCEMCGRPALEDALVCLPTVERK